MDRPLPVCGWTLTSFTVVYEFTLQSRRGGWEAYGRCTWEGEDGKGQLRHTESFPATLHSSWKWWMYHSDRNCFCFISFTPHLIPLLPTETTTELAWGHIVGVGMLCLLPSHSFIVCASPQRVTPASAELRVVVCNQKAWGWRRLQILRFTPKELAPESSKSPSRDPVSCTANTSLAFTCASWLSLHRW